MSRHGAEREREGTDTRDGSYPYVVLRVAACASGRDPLRTRLIVLAVRAQQMAPVAKYATAVDRVKAKRTEVSPMTVGPVYALNNELSDLMNLNNGVLGPEKTASSVGQTSALSSNH
jgi:hypothetical protein